MVADQRRNFVKSIGAASVLGLAGCIGDESGGVDMTIASNFPDDNMLVEAARRFKEIVEDESDGDFSVEISSGGAHGDAAEITEMTREGTVEATTQGPTPFEQYAPGYSYFQAPFVPEDLDHIHRIMDHESFQPAHDILKEEGNQRQVGNMMFRGTRQTVTKEEWGPIESADDLQDLQIRIAPLETWQRIWSGTGADVVSVAWSEVYSAIQTGTADAAEAGPPDLQDQSLQEVTAYLSQTDNLTSVGSMYVNEGFYQGLDDSHQELLDEAMIDASEYGSEITRESEQEVYENFEEAGMTIIPREEIDRESIVAETQDTINKLFDELYEVDFESVSNI